MKSYDGWVRLKGGVEIAGLWVEEKDVQRLISLNAELVEALKQGVSMARDVDASDPDEVGRAFDRFLAMARPLLEKITSTEQRLPQS